MAATDADMLTDLLLAIAHHLLIFTLFGLLVVEMMMLRPDMSRAALLRLARLDIAYGVVAGLIVVIGFSRVHFGLKGAAFYEHNPVFWAKIGAFVLIGLISIAPTLRIIRWRRASDADPAFRPDAAEVASTKRLMHNEGFVFVLVLIFAAMMARGIGL
jgi:putative membrane protein